MDFYDLCRFCLKFVEITERNFLSTDVKNQFEYLTNEELISQVGSDFSCKNCLTNLDLAYSTKESFLKNQEILVNKTNHPEFLSVLDVVIKEEQLEGNANFQSDSDNDQKSKIKEEPPTESKKNLKKSVKQTRKPGKQKKKRESYHVTCEECGAKLKSCYLSRHKATVHRKLKNFFCDVCGHGFSQKYKITQHLKAHFNIKDVPCDECDRYFVSNDYLATHKKYVHQGIRFSQKTTCEFCGKVCATKQNYQDHRRTHTKQKPYVCDIPGCGHAFTIASSLMVHKKFKHSDKMETCPICLKQVKILKSHLKKNHTERNYVCEFETNGQICGKKFCIPSELKTHSNLVHRGVCPCVCEFCNSAFKTNQHLRSHILNIHENRKIQCDLCPTLMGSKNYYNKHVKARHKELDDVARENILKKIRETPEEKLFNYQK